MSAGDDANASFGFREVPADEKARLVRGVFDKVASRYDLMNDLMSAGLHRVWKSIFIDRLNPRPGEALLDVAGGTGDIARAFLGRADSRPRAGTLAPARAIVCDINLEMLKAGRLRPFGSILREAAFEAAPQDEAFAPPHPEERREARRLQGCPEAPDERLTHVCGDAETLPFPDKSVDAYTIAFGIRNVTHIESALAEARRVLKIGGRFQCLEFSHVASEGLQKLYDAYSFNVIPWLGERVTGDRESYRYLVESIRLFPKQERFAEMIGAAGFQRVTFENLSAGVVAIHAGRRL